MSRRQLRKLTIDVEEQVQKIGHGIKTQKEQEELNENMMSNIVEEPITITDIQLSNDADIGNVDDIWGNKSLNNSLTSLQEAVSMISLTNEDWMSDRSGQKAKKVSEKKSDRRKSSLESGLEVEEDKDRLGSLENGIDRIPPLKRKEVKKKGPRKKRNDAAKDIKPSNEPIDPTKKESVPQSDVRTVDDQNTVALPKRLDMVVNNSITDYPSSITPRESTTTVLTANPALIKNIHASIPKMAATESMLNVGKGLQSSPVESSIQASSAFNILNSEGKFYEVLAPTDEKITKRDINFVLHLVDRSTDYTIICLINTMVVLAFAEILGLKDIYEKINSHVHEFAADFISGTLKAVWDALRKEFSNGVDLNEIRDLNAFKTRLGEMMDCRATVPETKSNPETTSKTASQNALVNTDGAENVTENAKVEPVRPKFKYRKLHHKFKLLNDLFTSVDIHIFPRFLEAHKDGTKSLCYSKFDSALWL